jgi:hypothetical protein
MGVRNPHAVIDRINAEQDRVIASRLRRDRRVLGLARRNLKRWMARDKRPRPVFVEWNLVLTRLTPREIADFLESGTPMAKRLAQSSPFAGVLSDAERLGIYRKHQPIPARTSSSTPPFVGQS